MPTCGKWKFVHFNYYSGRKLFKTRFTVVPSRCNLPRNHVEYSKWHCSDSTRGGTGYIWLVSEKERG